MLRRKLRLVSGAHLELCFLPHQVHRHHQVLFLLVVVGRQRKNIPENVMETARTVLHIMAIDTADGTTDIATAKAAFSVATSVMVVETN